MVVVDQGKLNDANKKNETPHALLLCAIQQKVFFSMKFVLDYQWFMDYVVFLIQEAILPILHRKSKSTYLYVKTSVNVQLPLSLSKKFSKPTSPLIAFGLPWNLYVWNLQYMALFA